MKNSDHRGSALERCLLGMAVGDSMGLPMEGLSRRAIGRLGWMVKPRQRFFFNKGMISDDTEHAMMTLNAVLASDGNVEMFKRSLRMKLKWWFIGLPAGVGMATAKSCLKMWLGLRDTGVYSAGNGPAMRSVILGVMYSDDEARRRVYVRATTELTHSDQKALIGARVVAELGALFTREPQASDGDVNEIIRKENLSGGGGSGWEERCEKGVSGYMMNTVPALIDVGVKHQWHYENSMTAMIKMGGDTDTTAAILGALCGAKKGEIPSQWIDGVAEYPRSVKAMRSLTKRTKAKRFNILFVFAVLIRNIVFLMIVLVHGFRRLLDYRMWR